MELNSTAQAKINLYLHVTGKRTDGYHLLDSLIAFADIGDEISVLPADDITLEITGEFADNLSNEDNLILKVARLLQEKYSIDAGAKIKLVKNLPIGAGIGGGSADAATAAKLLVKLWNLPCNYNELAKILLPLGADLPVCIYSKASYISGIGEGIELASNFPPLNIVLVNPLKHVSTPEIFKIGFNSYKEPICRSNLEDTGQLIETLSKCSNDLEKNAVTIRPEILDIIEAINSQEGCKLTRMSGSGATCFGLFNNQYDAEKAAIDLSKKHPKWWVKPAIIT